MDFRPVLGKLDTIVESLGRVAESFGAAITSFGGGVVSLVEIVQELKSEVLKSNDELISANSKLIATNDKIIALELANHDLNSQLTSTLEQLAAALIRIKELEDGTVDGEKPDEIPPPPPPLADKLITSVEVVSSPSFASAPPTPTVITFALSFSRGTLLPSQQSIVAKMADKTQPSVVEVLEIQADHKAHWPDGSVRHSVISILVQDSGKVDLYASSNKQAIKLLLVDASLADVIFKVSGSLGSLEFKPTTKSTWLSGSLVNECRYIGAVGSTSLLGILDLRVDVHGNRRASFCIENCYHDRAATIVYDCTFGFGFGTVDTTDIQHYHHTRWRRVLWSLTGRSKSNPESQYHIRHDPDYLASTGAIPLYDPRHRNTPPATIEAIVKRHSTSNLNPLGNGIIHPSMGDGGGRGDIGLIPQWSVIALLSGDRRMWDVMLDCGDRAGSFSTHYRDRSNGKIYSIVDHPTATLNSQVAAKSAPADKITLVANDSPQASPYKPDGQHQPSLAYLPYLLTGDHYYLDELQYWHEWNLLIFNFEYRQRDKGIIGSVGDPARQQAWMMRALANYLYVVPDADADGVTKRRLETILGNNINWYSTELPKANSIGAWSKVNFNIEKYPAEVEWMYRPWQIDFCALVWKWIVDMRLDRVVDGSGVVAKWFAQNVTKRHMATLQTPVAGKKTLDKAQAHGYDLAGGKKIDHKWVEDWSEVARLTPLDLTTWRPKDPFHYQAIARAAAAAAVDLQLPDAATVYTQLDLACEATPGNYNSDPTWCMVAKTKTKA